MHLHAYRLKNYRRLVDAYLELDDTISIFVGANNSGKTSATQALKTFVNGNKKHFSLYDFSHDCWSVFDNVHAADGSEVTELPTISLDLWFSVNASDLYLVVPLLPNLSWQGTKVGIRVEFGAADITETVRRFRDAYAAGESVRTESEKSNDKYQPWPKSLSDFLERELHAEYEMRYYVLDESQFNQLFVANTSYKPAEIGAGISGSKLIQSIIRVDYLNAQRHLTDPSTLDGPSSGRAESLSKRLSSFYKRNLDRRQDDHAMLKALFQSERGLNEHLAKVFSPTFLRLQGLGYPGLHNPRMEIRSLLNPASIMAQDAQVHYVLEGGQRTTLLPDSYNGLGFKNLIYMVVEILDLKERWRSDMVPRPPLHLICIEEPEAHLHAQLQQVFIRNALELMKADGDEESAFHSQTVVTTHSPHILYERGFKPIRYFRRDTSLNGSHSTTILNLSSFYASADKDDVGFLEKYVKLTHCDLFFADAVILVEGNVERLLLPLMIEQTAPSLRSACLSILEVGGAFAYRFQSLIEFLGLVALVVTDIDSVLPSSEPDVGGDSESEDILEFDVNDEAPDKKPRAVRAKSCQVGDAGAVTSNQTLRSWLPRKSSIEELLNAGEDERTDISSAASGHKVRICYQAEVSVSWNNESKSFCGRTLEETFGLENTDLCQSDGGRTIGLRLRSRPATVDALASGLYKRVQSKSFDKTSFALNVLCQPSWQVPSYIADGLKWLEAQIPFETDLAPVHDVQDESLDGAV